MSEGLVRRRFTLRELFVVITGICVLLAVLVPWIHTSREAARRTQCENNLHNNALALQNYHDTYRVFPMGAMHAGPNPGGVSPVNAKLGPSWYYGCRPFMESRGLYDKMALTQQPSWAGGQKRNEFCANDMIAAGEPLNFLQYEYMRCPASPLPEMETPAGPIWLPTYVGVAGGCDIDSNSNDYRISASTVAGLVAPTTSRIYHNKFKGTGAAAGGIVTCSGMLPPCEQVWNANCLDGVSNTMIVAEQSDWLLDQKRSSSKNYHGDAGWTVGGTGPGGGWLSGTRRVDRIPKVDTPGGPPAIWGADCWNITTVRYPPNFKRVMGPNPLPGCSEDHGINNPLQSPHRGGLQAAMVDGSVRFISEKADLAILLRLAIRDDGQSDQIGLAPIVDEAETW